MCGDAGGSVHDVFQLKDVLEAVTLVAAPVGVTATIIWSSFVAKDGSRLAAVGLLAIMFLTTGCLAASQLAGDWYIQKVAGTLLGTGLLATVFMGLLWLIYTPLQDRRMYLPLVIGCGISFVMSNLLIAIHF